jgi:hypothetical protein
VCDYSGIPSGRDQSTYPMQDVVLIYVIYLLEETIF